MSALLIILDPAGDELVVDDQCKNTGDHTIDDAFHRTAHAKKLLSGVDRVSFHLAEHAP